MKNMKEITTFIDNSAKKLHDDLASISNKKSTPPKSLVHYAPPDVLHSILEGGVLWATDLRYTNDLSEISHSVQVVSSAFNNKITADNKRNCRKIKTNTLDGFLACPVAFVTERFADWMNHFDYYSVSFCETERKISQWRAYAADGTGVALKFDVSWTGKDQNETGEWTRIRVMYDDTPLEDISRRAIDFLETLVKSRELKNLRKVQNAEKIVQYLITTTLVHLGPFMMRFKHNFFHEEDEWRIARVFVKGDETADIRHHSRRGVFTPYIPLPYRLRMKDRTKEAGEAAKGGPVPVLTEVILGPRADSRNKDSLEAFFARKGADVKVRQQSAPLR
ncbi:MAG: DUF2971 domain-containing protein [Magnetospirillum sp. WYHS-4]